jgi:predicted RNase H-like HicB family nuclease
MKYAYSCNIVPDEEEGEGFVINFPDVKGAITGAKTFKESLVKAEDCLLVALCAYVDCNEDIPIPSPPGTGQELIAVEPLPAAKLALYSAMRRKGITKAELSDRTGLSEPTVRKLLIPDRYSHISHVTRALDAVGCRLVVEDLVA